jgi:thiosulfate dehydrogenase
MLGYRIVMHTRRFLPEHVGAEMDCRNCHFEGGLTDGGTNDGISLVGAAAVYPRLDLDRGRPIDLPTRINDCFRRNLNGTLLAHDSPEMTALVSYCRWISQGVPIYTTVPWLGLEQLESPRPLDLDAGAVLHKKFCAVCHGENGQGTEIAPPQWGPEAFTTASSLHDPQVLAAFVHANMPRYNPILRPEQARDVAGFLVSRPHPEAETP